MSGDLLSALAPLLDRVQQLVQTDPKLRHEVATLGRALAGWSEAVPRPDVPAPDPPPPRPAAPPIPVNIHHPSPSTVIAHAVRRAEEHESGDSLGWMPQEPAIIAARCRTKGEAARLVSKKYANLMDEGQYLSAVAEVRSHAEKLPKCTLWMLDMSALSRSSVVWEDLVGGYVTAADAAELLQLATDPAAKVEPDQMLLALNLAAEAQSLLFSAVIDTGNPRPDADQIQLYVTVRELATARNTYIHRYLRREDRVDPRTWPDLRKRIAAAAEPLGALKKQTSGAKKVLANLKFKLKKAAADGPERYDEWPRVMELLDEAVSTGIPANSPELRDGLLPVLDGIPEDVMVPVKAAAVLSEVDKFLAGQLIVPEGTRIYSPDVPATAARLRGAKVVLIGGHVRPAEKLQLERALELAELRWVCGPDAEANIARPDVSLVLFAVRWATLDFPEVQRLCAAHAKRLVRLPAGYHPNAVAKQILQQSESSMLIA
jgi:hypothetical protein